MYYLISSLGYLSTFDRTKEIVCIREPHPLFGKKIDYFMTLGKLGVYITILISVPIIYVTLRRAMLNLFVGTNYPVKNPENLLMTFAMLTASTLICIFFPKLRSVISIIGGFCAPIICYIVPSKYIYIYIYK